MECQNIGMRAGRFRVWVDKKTRCRGLANDRSSQQCHLLVSRSFFSYFRSHVTACRVASPAAFSG